MQFIWEKPYNLRRQSDFYSLLPLPPTKSSRYGVNSLAFRESLLWSNLLEEFKNRIKNLRSVHCTCTILSVKYSTILFLGAYISYFKMKRFHFLLIPLFWKNISRIRINRMKNEHTVDYHLSLSELTSSIQPLMFLWTPKGFISP